MFRVPLTTLMLVAITLCGMSVRADQVRTEQVRLSPELDRIAVVGRITGCESVHYTVGARAGQAMGVLLHTDNPSAYFNIFAPGKRPGQDSAMFVGSVNGGRFAGRLPSEGDYTIQLFLMRNAARRNEVSHYTVEVRLAEDPSAASLPRFNQDYADGLAGGPDYWAVSEVRSSLNIRRRPSVRAAKVTALPPGAVLRNLGCRMSEGWRWCEVEGLDGNGVRGWAAGHYLHEGGVPVSTGKSDSDALVAGTKFNATGMIPCARYPSQPMNRCRFGVERKGDGSGTVSVFWPQGGSRVIYFTRGDAVGSDQGEPGHADFSATRKGDLTLIRIGGERFEIPDAVVSGG